MTDWTADELTIIGAADETEIASQRPDGSFRPYVTIWSVALGDGLYVRSAYGYDNPWFQRALAAGQGRIRVAGLERDVAFVVPGPEIAEDLHAAYHAKYDHYSRAGVRSVTTPEATRSTLRLDPR